MQKIFSFVCYIGLLCLAQQVVFNQCLLDDLSNEGATMNKNLGSQRTWYIAQCKILTLLLRPWV